MQLLRTLKNADVHVENFKVNVSVIFPSATYHHNPARIMDLDERPSHQLDHPLSVSGPLCTQTPSDGIVLSKDINISQVGHPSQILCNEGTQAI
jgi:hypothetical protein